MFSEQKPAVKKIGGGEEIIDGEAKGLRGKRGESHFLQPILTSETPLQYDEIWRNANNWNRKEKLRRTETCDHGFEMPIS